MMSATDLPKTLGRLMSGADLQPTRRAFLVGATAAAGGLMIGLGLRGATAAEGDAANPLQAYIHITPDNRVTILSAQFDMGQGSYHGIATLVVEELRADWSQVTVEGAAGPPTLYGNLAWGGAYQGTGGSSSMASSYERYRRAGAVAREMLIAAAAKRWNVPAAEISVAAGVVSHGANSATFGEFAEAAAGMPVPQDVALKPRDTWTEIGNANLRRYDSASKTDGTHPFTIDVKLPGMLTAVIAHPPRFGATVAGFDDSAARAVKGVTDVVPTPRGVAVVAEHMWAAIKGREALVVEWDESRAEKRGSREILDGYHEASRKQPIAMARVEGDVETALAEADEVVEASFEFPYLAHAALEPLNAVAARSDDGTVEVWGGHQIPTAYQYAVAQVAGVEPTAVRLHVEKTGGSFGRRAVPDADVVLESVMVAKAIGWRAPVKVQWTREDDMTGGRYRPAYVHRMRAGLKADGSITAWDDHIVGQSIAAGTPFEDAMVKDGVDHTSVEGAANNPYAIPNMTVGLSTQTVGVPVLWWRAVGSTHTAFAVEAFLDELAEKTGQDPVALRLSLLKDKPRHVAVLNKVAEESGWDGPAPEGRARGLALHESFHSVVGHVVEVSMDGDTPTVHKVTAAIDCGTAINPDTIKAQIEGGTAFGLGAVLGEELTLDQGRVRQTNYDGYTPLRMDQAPEVTVHILPSTEPPTGVGEPGVPGIGPAVANAVARATGRRIRRLPFGRGMG